ncbi:MAG: HIT family protein [Nitrosarchaeum sp.]|nr:HIT family protein [Nitrosarchaeum sp.]
MEECVFCKIVKEELPCHKVWEDGEHLAFLSIFPNTDGVTVVIPKKHYGSYAFQLDEEVYTRLVLAARRVGLRMDRAFDDVGRTALVFEGFGVDHVHAKLFPMHGTGGQGAWRPILSGKSEFFTEYLGFISTHDAARAMMRILRGSRA